MRFGIWTDQNLPWPTLVEPWRCFEGLGFDSIWVCDHLNQPSRPTNPYFEAWTTLAGRMYCATGGGEVFASAGGGESWVERPLPGGSRRRP
jgi:hypothetical protein